MGGREAPPHFVDEAVFAYYFSLFWVIFGNILKKMLKTQKIPVYTPEVRAKRAHLMCRRVFF